MSRCPEQSSPLLVANGMKVRQVQGLFWVIRKSNRPWAWTTRTRECHWPTARQAIAAAEAALKEENA